MSPIGKICIGAVVGGVLAFAVYLFAPASDDASDSLNEHAKTISQGEPASVPAPIQPVSTTAGDEKSRSVASTGTVQPVAGNPPNKVPNVEASVVRAEPAKEEPPKTDNSYSVNQEGQLMAKPSMIITNNDLNKDGIVTKDEATKAGKALIQMWDAYDLNKDGMVDDAELTKASRL